MQRATKVVLSVAVVVALAAGTYALYVVSPPPPMCAGVVTPTGPNVSNRPAVGVDALSGSAGKTAPVASTPAMQVATPSVSGPVINVVAAENFWGSLVAQIGGTHVNVTSIITDPNTDPHEYEANDSTAEAFKDAQYVILNNVGYDDWATLLVGGDGAVNQTVLNVGDMLGVNVTGGIVSGNPHLWYNPTYVNQTVAWIYHNLTAIAPSLGGYFTDQYDNLTAALGTLYSEVTAIRDRFGGTVVASTESIFVYLANATGLDLVSPPTFMEAVAEGNDPSDQSIVTFECQLESGHVRVLVYNQQTVTPITTMMEQLAESHNVTIVPVTETIQPPTATFQAWMGGQLDYLWNALDANELGQ